MYGKRVDFMPWGKMPLRDPQERIARVGQGFSKMLGMIQPDGLPAVGQSTKYSEGFYTQNAAMAMQDDTTELRPKSA